MDSVMVPLIFSIAVFVLMFIAVIASVVLLRRYRRTFKWSFRGKELELTAQFGRAQLAVGGAVVDEFAADRLRVCTLKAFIEGTEVRVHIAYRAFKVEAEASAAGAVLPLLYAGK